ncbi:MAG TPA: hypothetical protein DIW36_00540 [Ruminococcaceae bacterium]|nr:hypothetical protein [Oscillospiraceae bacterium]
MKKLLSVTLAIVMMFSISIIAFAADKPAIELGKEYTVTLDNTTLEYTLTIPKDGAYRLSGSLLDQKGDMGMASVTVSDDNSSFSLVSLYYWNDPEFADMPIFHNTEDEDIFMAKKGSKLTVSVGSGEPLFDSDEEIKFPEVTVKFKIASVTDLHEIKIGESYTVNGEEYFLFKPTENGFIDIWSHQCQNISVMDTDGSIYTGYSGADGFPVDLFFEYKAGEIYGICVESNFDEIGNNLDSVFHVVDAKTIQPDIIDLEDITVIWGDYEYVSPDIYPLGSFYNCGELEYTIENEKVATVEYDAESDMYVIHGNRPGKTTLTVTEPNSGITREVEVEVITRTTAFFRSIFEFISNIFNFVFGR